jgi:UDP-3-O-[3-hydroxymyristoyl] glucosamine N-acyltransferase
MTKKLKDLAKLVRGEVQGDPNISIKGVASIESAGAGEITFALEQSSLAAADRSTAAAIVCSKRSKPKKPAILVDNPRLALAYILPVFAKKMTVQKGIHKMAFVSPSAGIGKDSYVGPFAYIGNNSKVGANCVIHPNVVIYDGVTIGDRVIIHSGAVIGVDGFGFAQENGKHVKIPQIGGVVIEDDVEIYSNTIIARATMENTVIKRGTKIDCLTHIAHNCVIGEDCAITSLIGFAGSVTLGNGVFIGGMAGLQNKVNVGDGTVIMAKSGVTKDIPKNSVISGFPAQDHKKELEMQALMHRLPELFKKFSEQGKGQKDEA